MTNEELKKKIVEVLKKAMEPIEYGGDSEHAPEVHYPTEEEIADALIAAGIGDVREAKFEGDHYWRMWQGALVELERAEHRALVAERALKNMAADYWGVECFCHGCSESRCRESCGEKYLVYDEEDAVSCLFKNFLEQAEKELAEERKDD